MTTSGLGLGNRGDALESLSSRTFDVLVIGGGITGAGIALDAASRGMRVALVEKNDFASGTSSKSSKLIHGGLRYLQTGDLSLVYEAAAERDLLRRLAPDQIKAVQFFWPGWAGGRSQAGIGLWMYDGLAAYRNVRRHQRINTRTAADLLPGTRKTGGGYAYFDAMTDDARLVISILRTARSFGAVVCNHLRVDHLLTSGGQTHGCVASAGGTSIEIKATEVVNATGVWAAELGLGEKTLRPSKGVHIVVSKRDLPIRSACIVKGAHRRSLVFMIPWRSSVIVGTTDDEYSGDLDAPDVDDENLQYLLDTLNKAFEREYTAGDITGAYAGLRPLLSDPKKTSTRDLSRRHCLVEGSEGLITVTGGKLTTYRRMARDVVDLISSRRGMNTECRTQSIKLGHPGVAAEVAERASKLGLEPEVAESLSFSYGDQALEVISLGQEQDLLVPLIDGLPYLAAEVPWGTSREMAVEAGDLFSRRMRISIEDRSAGLNVRRQVEAILSGSSSDHWVNSFARYEAAIARERGPRIGVGIKSSV
ncbi:MAG TPA: glycerol-3-phosphate dehydrogenase/oxidase [Actinomycetota bacterium]|nr:glycerol-3-phosphate dehydrogenase/oxidase [Actinomycetota bacterium]